mgnify:FL=1
MYQNGTQNIHMAMFLCVEIFVSVNLALAIQAHWAKPSRVTRQAVIVYSTWVVLWGAVLAQTLYRGTPWDTADAITLGLVATGAMVILLIARMYHTGIRSPLIRGYLSLAFKAVPQLSQAYKIVAMGGAPGLGWVMVLGGHATIMTRFGQLFFSFRESKSERNRIGLLVSEAGNELSWIIVTICWLVY